MTLRERQERCLLVNYLILHVILLHTWKRCSGMKWSMDRKEQLSMESMLMAVPFHVILMISLVKANGT